MHTACPLLFSLIWGLPFADFDAVYCRAKWYKYHRCNDNEADNAAFFLKANAAGY